MNEIALPKPNRISLEDLSLEELLDVRRGNQEYVAWLKAERTTADKDLGEIDTMITLRMEQTGARKFEHAGFRGGYVTRKSGSAKMLSPEIAREKLASLPEVPANALDETFEIVTPDPFVKGDLRKFRKLADYSAAAAAIVKAFIAEPTTMEVLEIEEIRPMIDVTPQQGRRRFRRRSRLPVRALHPLLPGLAAALRAIGRGLLAEQRVRDHRVRDTLQADPAAVRGGHQRRPRFANVSSSSWLACPLVSEAGTSVRDGNTPFFSSHSICLSLGPSSRHFASASIRPIFSG